MRELSGESEAARDLAMSRFRLIQPYLEQKRSLQLVASDAKICFRTVQRWVASIETRTCGARAQVTRGSRCPTGRFGEDQGSDRRTRS